LLFFFRLKILLFPMASSLTRKWVCSLQCLHSLVRSLTTSNHILPSHPRLCSLSVVSYDSQGRWRYSNPPPHGDPNIEEKAAVFMSLGAGWSSYTPMQWVPFSSPCATCRAAVEVFKRTTTERRS
jgi:hypothetical protein